MVSVRTTDASYWHHIAIQPGRHAVRNRDQSQRQESRQEPNERVYLAFELQSGLLYAPSVPLEMRILCCISSSAHSRWEMIAQEVGEENECAKRGEQCVYFM